MKEHHVLDHIFLLHQLTQKRRMFLFIPDLRRINQTFIIYVQF